MDQAERTGFDGWIRKASREPLRRRYPHSEKILFMEYAADGNTFKSPFGTMLFGRRKSVRMSTVDLAEAVGAHGAVNHGGAVANWEAGRNVPGKEQYARLKTVLSEAGAEDIPDYEDVIRPFNVSKDVEFTDVWTFESVRQQKVSTPRKSPSIC